MITFIDRVFRRYTPDPYLIAIVLTAAVAFLSLALTPSSPEIVIKSWGDGFWSLITFTLQMSMILVGGYILASSPLLRRGLKFLAQVPRSDTQSILWVSFISGVACWLNWGFGLVVGAFLALETGRLRPSVNFSVLLAAAYSGFLLWHGGLSGSIPLVLNTENNFSLQWTGRLIPISETLFSSFNIVTTLGLLLGLPFFNAWLNRMYPQSTQFLPPLDEPEAIEAPQTPAEKWERSWVITTLISFFSISYLLILISRNEFSLDLNTINFIFIFAGILLHGNPRSFLNSLEQAAKKVGPLLIQYPLYAGVMGIMVTTDLAQVISEFFVSWASAETFPFLSFLSAGLVNLFVPSGGGQWAVQAPVVIPAAQSLGASLPLTAMAVAWGDAWTNMLQPFWALPLLAIAGLRAKDILGFCLLVLLVSGFWISLCLLGFGFLN